METPATLASAPAPALIIPPRVIQGSPSAASGNDVEQTTTINRREQQDVKTDRPESLMIQDSSNGDSVYPEGGLHAWLCVAGSFCFLFPTFGLMQSVGTIQSYWEAHQLANYKPRDVGWIPGVFTFLGLLFGIQIGPIFDRYGPRVLGIIGTSIYVPMFFLLAQCKVYWQFLLCLGIMGGLGSAILTTVAMSVLSHWFMRRRGLAIGIGMSGSSAGGVILPILLRNIFPTLGYAWSIRILGFITMTVLFCGNLGIRSNPRLKQQQQQEHDQGVLAQTTSRTSAAHTLNDKRKSTISFSVFTNSTFTLFTTSVFALEFVMFGASGILPTYATIAGFPIEAGFYLTAILNGGSCLGRILPGYYGDRFGPFNVLIVMIILTLISMVVVWIPFGAKSLVGLYVFSGLWGFGTGSFLSATPVCVGKTCPTKDYGRYYGTMYSIASFACLITIPLSGQVVESVGPTALAGLYVGVLGFGCLNTIIARGSLLKRIKGRRWSVNIVV